MVNIVQLIFQLPTGKFYAFEYIAVCFVCASECECEREFETLCYGERVVFVLASISLYPLLYLYPSHPPPHLFVVLTHITCHILQVMVMDSSRCELFHSFHLCSHSSALLHNF